MLSSSHTKPTPLQHPRNPTNYYLGHGSIFVNPVVIIDDYIIGGLSQRRILVPLWFDLLQVINILTIEIIKFQDYVMILGRVVKLLDKSGTTDVTQRVETSCLKH